MFFKKNSYFKIIFLVFLLLFLGGVFFRGNENFFPGQSIVFFVLKKPALFFGFLGDWLGKKIDFIVSIGELKEENNRLFQENLRLKGDIAELKEVRNENQELRKELGLSQKEKTNLEASLVIVQRLENGKASFYIDKGSESGLREGMTVLVNQKFLLGKIKKVFWKGAEVDLILNADFLVGVEVQDQNVLGIVQGTRGIAVVLDKIPQSAKIETGQTLITSGLGGEFPRGFLVGYVGQELENEGGLFRRFSVDFPLELEKIRLVWVVKS